MVVESGSELTFLECSGCVARWNADQVASTCGVCGSPLLARYSLSGRPLEVADIVGRPAGQFRFHEMLPIRDLSEVRSLGEGGTPMITAEGFENVWVKDEASNPTGSFKARGMAVALTKHVEMGLDRFSLPSNGNAALAAAAYASQYGATVEVAVPDHTPSSLIERIKEFGATVHEVSGTISDAAAFIRQRAAEANLFSLATMYEPYRVEGKKMMGYEIFWDLGRLPDVILYPTGGGTGLIGMVKAFDEMEQLGWIGQERPHMVVVQMEGCAPIVEAFRHQRTRALPWSDPEPTSAYGLLVPATIGDRLILRGLRQTRGTAVAVPESALAEGVRRLSVATGLSVSPEGGACFAAFESLRHSGWLTEDEAVVVFNTGAAENYDR